MGFPAQEGSSAAGAAALPRWLDERSMAVSPAFCARLEIIPAAANPKLFCKKKT
eukprot:COSAG05_NODE_2275_length_3297_cov_87.259225_7_plen_54_part_00